MQRRSLFQKVPVTVALLAAALAPAGDVHAQNPTPRHRVIPGEWKYSARVDNAGRVYDVGIRSVTVSPVTRDGQEAWAVVMSMLLEGEPLLDSVLMERTGLQPISRHTLGPGMETRLAVVDSMARGLTSWDLTLTPLAIPLRPRSFMNYYALRASLRELPLAEDWTGSAHILELAPEPRFVALSLTVIGEERVTVPAGEYDCWRLQVRGSFAPIGIDELYWISKDELHVISTREPIGSDGAIMRLDLVAHNRQP